MEAITMTGASETMMPRSRKRQSPKSGKTDRPKAAGTVKATIVMSRNLDFLLSSIASYRGVDRSTLAASLIDKGLRNDQGELYRALSSFHPEKAGKASRDASGASNGSASAESELNAEDPSEA
jgi:hypothetical protein